MQKAPNLGVRRLLCGAAAIGLLAATPTRVADPMQLMSYLTGTWNCSVDIGGKKQTYKAVWAYTLGNAWLRETDSWPGGGDVAMLTYDRKARQWRTVVTESEGGITVFRAPDKGLAHVVYQSVYPDTSMNDIFDRTSTHQYTVHFVQVAGGKTTRGTDDCTKV